MGDQEHSQYEEDAALTPSWVHYTIMAKAVDRMAVRERRQAFHLMRKTPECTADSFMPLIGLTCGEFCVMHTLVTQPSARRGAGGQTGQPVHASRGAAAGAQPT